METLDLKKQYKHLYNPSAKAPVIVEVPRLMFARFDGQIEPDCGPGQSPAYAAALSALYGISYTLKFMLKKRKENPVDYPVMPLESFWWTDDGTYDLARPGSWRFTAQIMQPDVITPEIWAQGLDELHKKRDKGAAKGAIEKLRFESYEEGLSIQMMHLGPYKDEPATVAIMEEFQLANGYRFRGPHHEIYLSDPMRTALQKLKTVLRHAVERVP